MTISIKKVVICSALVATLFGCSRADKLIAPETKVAPMTQAPTITDKIKNIISDDSAQANDDLQTLKMHLEQQQQQLKAMSDEQQALQELLKRQNINIEIFANKDANAGRSQQGTASTAYIAFLDDESQFTEIEKMAAKEISIIPNRQSSLKLNIPQDAQFIAIKVGLRYTKKRSQLLIPIGSLDFDKQLTLTVGACDINIEDGILPELTPTFTNKLNYYQQPLVSCS